MIVVGTASVMRFKRRIVSCYLPCFVGGWKITLNVLNFWQAACSIRVEHCFTRGNIDHVHIVCCFGGWKIIQTLNRNFMMVVVVIGSSSVWIFNLRSGHIKYKHMEMGTTFVSE